MTEEIKKMEPKADKPLEKMTVKELREIALDIPHAHAVHDMKKEEIIAFIRETRGGRDEAPARKKEKVVKLKMTKTELKTKIRELKGLTERAREEKDGKQIRTLRHRISRLKKKSRKAVGAS
jgi:hypothetical protein